MTILIKAVGVVLSGDGVLDGALEFYTNLKKHGRVVFALYDYVNSSKHREVLFDKLRAQHFITTDAELCSIVQSDVYITDVLGGATTWSNDNPNGLAIVFSRNYTPLQITVAGRVSGVTLASDYPSILKQVSKRYDQVQGKRPR